MNCGIVRISSPFDLCGNGRDWVATIECKDGKFRHCRAATEDEVRRKAYAMIEMFDNGACEAI